MCESGNTCQTTARRSTLSEWFFAKFWAKTHRSLEAKFRPTKERLFNGISGKVLEIGPGTGSNFQFYPKNIELIAVEPNIHMHPYMKEEAVAQGLNVRIEHAFLEDLNIEDASLDAVVSTLVLCSVRDQEKAIRDILRILKPSGTFYFIEHVAATEGSMMRLAQGIVTPLWKRLADGCHPNRETWRTLEEAGFSKLEFVHEYVKTPFVLTNTLIHGRVTK